VTSIVGVLCTDGAVVGTDSATLFTSAQVATIEQQTEKIDIIGSSVIVAGTGAVGLHQRFSSVVNLAYEGQLLQSFPPHMGGPNRAPASGKVFTKESPMEIAKTLSRAAIEDMAQTYLNPGRYGALVAFPCRNEPHLCEFPLSDFQPELKEGKRVWYVSMGSAQAITDPFLGFMRRAFWQDGVPSVSDAVFVVTWTLQHAIDLNTGGVNGPIRMAVLEKHDGKYSARHLDVMELEEHQQHINDTYAGLFKLRNERRSAAADEIPEVSPA
jgi:hypothetical protein